MTKVWLLYDNPNDDGDNVYGIFSSEEKADKAKEIFSPLTSYDLYISEYELDDLEKHFERALSGYHYYIGRRERYQWSTPITYGKWEGLWKVSLDSFLYYDENKKDSVFETKYQVNFVVKAKSEEEAIQIAEKIFNDKSEGYVEWLK